MKSIGRHHAIGVILVALAPACIDVGELRPASDAGATVGPATMTALSTVLGDLDGDGRDDVAVVDNVTGKASVLLGNGTAFVTQSASRWPPSVAFADLDGDGTLDLAVTRLDGDGSTAVYVFLNNLPGAFADPSRYPVPEARRANLPPPLSAKDSSGDGRPDLSVGEPGGARVLTNRGQGRFFSIPADGLLAPNVLAPGCRDCATVGQPRVRATAAATAQP